MTQYIYAIPDGDWTYQHLLPRSSGGALCGAKANIWTTANPTSRPFPGVSLCDDCKQERRQRIADAEADDLRNLKESIKTFWIRNSVQ